MPDVLLFHHAQGLTDGVVHFADRLRAAGHRVSTPDLYDGRTFEDLDEGVAYAQEVGEETVLRRGVAAAMDLPSGAVVGGFSLGCASAQQIAQNTAGLRGALLYHGGNAPHWFGAPWPAAVALQVHVSTDDPWAEHEEVAELMAAAADGALFVYPGAGHLVTDDSLPAYEPDTAGLILDRTLELLSRLD